MSNKYLDYSGLAYFWSKAKTAFAANAHTHLYAGSSTAGGSATSAIKLNAARAIDGVSFNGTANAVHYAVCSTESATAAKTVACTGFTLASGSRITVFFSVTNTAANPTLNVNSTGARPIYYRNAAISAGYLAAKRVYEFVYDGTQYELVGDLNVDTFDCNRLERSTVIAGIGGVMNYSLILQDSDGRFQSLTTTTGTAMMKNINTTAKFIVPANIYYYLANNTIAEGNNLSTYALYTLYGRLDLRYSTNCTTTAFTSAMPIYIEGVIDDVGYFSPTENCITQTLRKGYYYILLGVVNASYFLCLQSTHPCYYYNGTDLVDYTKTLVSNKNLLRNPDFTINQRCISGTFTAIGNYFVDRWRLISGSVSVNLDGSLTLDGTIAQTLEQEAGTDITVTSSAGVAEYDNSTKTFTITATEAVITWAKLELGNVPTKFIRPDTTTELLECQRYYYRSVGVFECKPFYNQQYITVNVVFPSKMRITPTVNLQSQSGTDNMLSLWDSGLDSGLASYINGLSIWDTGFNSIFTVNPPLDMTRVYAFRVIADAEIY